MRLYFLRHADAADGLRDDLRPLTQKGHDQSGAIGTWLNARGICFDAAFTSPLVRAVETAEIVLAHTNGKKNKIKLQQTNLLLNETSPQKFAAWLAGLKEKEVLLVGHNPSMTEHVARLLGVDSPVAVEMSKGALAMIRFDSPAACSLKLFLTPKATGLMPEE
jgi:phosphohistidine phosphatase